MTLLEVATAVTASPVVETDAIEAAEVPAAAPPETFSEVSAMRSRQRPSATTARSTLRLLRLSRSGNR